ncbi:hypothetical protein P154DRAFT_619154 [Amniculicola lignicola CBS 123094]|uniref:GST N-terminal domain-containing protein n=1 Tax=Amniculicola lignicola CBS 123094 TaxID=1392246 RepID=A0A6A5WJD9_9PLEO|nr:hypothetical protein P154DRAFT_619154 [Amniculicola lignicola CBS 123094]
MAPMKEGPPMVVLFGYDSSPFTNKVRLVLRVKGIPFAYHPVPSMLPRPVLTSTFALTYRKIPILAIGREIYCDTSLIIEALEHYFPTSEGWGTAYPEIEGVDGWVYRGLVRGFASFWVDRPIFRATTGLIPASVWKTDFGTDRAGLIGHKLDSEKLGKKLPQNLSTLDAHLELLEPMFSGPNVWLLPTKTPSLADVSLFYQLKWGSEISAGKGIYNLTGGGTNDTQDDVITQVFNEERYPEVWKWFHAFEAHLSSLPDREMTISPSSTEWKETLKSTPFVDTENLLVPTSADQHVDLDTKQGLVQGAVVSIAPDDTGRDSPTMGILEKIGVDEVVIRPMEPAEMDVRIHFPRLGFVVRPIESPRL